MPATPIYQLPYPAATDPADVPLDMQELCTQLEIVIPGRYRGALTPAQFGALTGVADGDICDLIVDAANGVVWRMRYRAASGSAYKWEYIGGPALSAYDTTSIASSGTWAAINPAIIVPRAGEYDVEWLGVFAINGASQFYAAFYVDATRNDSVTASAFGTAGAQEITYYGRNRAPLTPAGATIKAGHVNTGTAGATKGRTIRITPVRIS